MSNQNMGEMMGITDNRQTIACAMKAHTLCKGIAEGGIRCCCKCHPEPLLDLFHDLFGGKDATDNSEDN